jgi:hypothetical protein
MTPGKSAGMTEKIVSLSIFYSVIPMDIGIQGLKLPKRHGSRRAPVLRVNSVIPAKAGIQGYIF